MRTLVLLLLAAGLAAAQEARILAQEVRLVLAPESGTFTSTVVVQAEGPGTLALAAMEGVTGAWDIEGALPPGPQRRTATLAGRIANPVTKAQGPTWVAGDRTPGTIGSEGSYLVRGFYLPSAAPCRFAIEITVPLPHRAVSQGRRVEEREEEGVYRVRYEAAGTQDALVVVAGPWEVDEETIGDAVCRTYLYPQDRSHKALLLATLREELPRFTAIFGPLPEGRFDVVENFFATGYGFPEFTLLGDSVIRYVCAKTAREGKRVLPAGYLDHELVHCWLGNRLLVDYSRGNWCEALTTYFANYGAAEREDGGAAYRARVSSSYSLRVDGANDYPLREFRSKSHAFENDLGYGKGSMLFHMLAREIGREALEGAVRHALLTRGGRALGWDDLVAALGEGCGRDLAPFFEPWLARTGAPVLEAGSLRVQGNRITGTLLQAQAGPPYPLPIPLRITTSAGTEEHVVFSNSKETAFTLEAKAAPTLLEIDPEHHIFRRVPRERCAPCLQAVVTAPRRVGFGDEALLASLEIERIEPALPADAAVLAVGLPAAVRDALVAGATRQMPDLRFAEGSFRIGDALYDRPGDALLVSFARVESPGLPVTLFCGNGPEAYARSRTLPYYATEGWVVFRDGAPVARGVFPADRAARAEITAARTGEPEGLVRDLLWLTDPSHAGRRAGTAEAYNLANELRGRLHRAGLAVLPWPAVEVPHARLVGDRVLTLLHGDEKVRLEGVFFPFHRTASPENPAVFTRIAEGGGGEAEKALVLLPEGAGEAEVERCIEAGAAVVALVASEPSMKALARDAVWPGALPPSLAEEAALRGVDPALGAAGRIVAGQRRRLKVPFVYLSPAAAEELRRRGCGGVLEFSVRLSLGSTSNLVGVFGEAVRPGILLSAHWDGVGTLGGAPAQGAADNAAGCAIVLWVAELLRRDHDAGRFRRPVVLALFGAEEMGLLGSTQFAALTASGQGPIPPPRAAVNVDGIGSHLEGEVFLVGRSEAPSLLAAFERAMEGSGLALGRDIDRFAFREGSDHWPLHKIGVPAVTIYSADYRAMNTARDTVDRVDVGSMRRIALAVHRMVRDLAMAE